MGSNRGSDLFCGSLHCYHEIIHCRPSGQEKTTTSFSITLSENHLWLDSFFAVAIRGLIVRQ